MTNNMHTTIREQVLNAVEKEYPNLLTKEEKEKVTVTWGKIDDNFDFTTNAALIIAAKLAAKNKKKKIENE